MKKLIDLLNEICSDAFIKAGYEAGFGRVNVSNRPDLCEYQCNGAMAAAKAAHKKPMDIATEVAEQLKNNKAFARALACMPGFINMDLNPAFLADYLKQQSGDADLGIQKEEKKRYIVDYGGANVAKPLHLGHLRSAVIGESLKRLGTAMGNEMIGDVHLGDWGLQMGLIIEELKDRNQTEFTLADLEEIYPAASAKSKAVDAEGNLTPEAAAFKERALEATRRLQESDPECIRIWNRIMELSKADLKKNYDNMNVGFELWKGESDVQKYIPDMLKDLEKRGIAREDAGALVVDIAEEGDKKEMPPCLIRKSDGASLYATTDLATLLERDQLYHPDGYIYTTDKRQELHFESFFRVARKADIVHPDQSLRHLGFGTMNGKDGKPFKTRNGGVMRLEMLIKDINDAVYEKIRSSRDESEISEEEAREIAKIVGLAALKYGDLSNQAAKDYIFDIDRFTSFEGNTGPYILYTIVRIGSILKAYDAKQAAAGGQVKEGAVTGAAGQTMEKADAVLEAEVEEADFAPALEVSKDAKNLALTLSRFNETVENAWKELAPHKICQYIYEVSENFNTFYHNVMILKEQDPELQASYISLLRLTKRVLERCIDMLGFSAPERM